jgi:hypothetical protein
MINEAAHHFSSQKGTMCHRGAIDRKLTSQDVKDYLFKTI